MPTVLDELVVALRLDTSGFTDGQRKALSEFERLKNNVQTSAQTIGTSAASSLHEYLGSIHHELQDVNVALLAMSAQSRRAGESVRAGANAGSDGLKNLATAAASAVAGIAAVHETIGGLAGTTGRAAQDVRAAWQTGVSPSFLRAFEQYAFAAGNVDPGTTQSTLAGFEQRRQLYKSQGQYPEEFQQFAFYLGKSPSEIADMPMPELLELVSARVAQQGTSGPLAQLIASQTSFGPLGYVLGQGPQALRHGIASHMGIGDDDLNRLNELNKSINDVENSWQNMTASIVAGHPEWKAGIDDFKDAENWLTANKDASHALGVALEALATVSIVTALSGFTKLVAGLNAVWATPLLRFIAANPIIAGLLFGLHSTPAGEPGKPAMTPEEAAHVDVNKLSPAQAQQLLDTGFGLPDDLRERLSKRARGETAVAPSASPTSSNFNPANGTDIEMASAAIRAAGGNDNAVAGALGAMFAESKMNPGLVAPGGDTSWAQWVGKRKQRLYALGWRPGDPQAQRQASAKLLSEELTGPFHNTLMRMNAVPPTQAGKIFGFDFEQGGGNPSLFGTGHETQASLDAFHSRYADKFYGMVHDARAGGGSSTTNNTNSNISTGPITVNVPSGNPLSVGGAVHQAVRDALVTHANTGVSG